jgi:hypothetical protein
MLEATIFDNICMNTDFPYLYTLVCECVSIQNLDGSFYNLDRQRLLLKPRGLQIRCYVRQLTNQWLQPVGSGVASLRPASWGFSYCIAHLSLRLVRLTLVFIVLRLGEMSSSKSPQTEALTPQVQSSPAEPSATDQGNAPAAGKVVAPISTGDNQPTIEAQVSRISPSD